MNNYKLLFSLAIFSFALSNNVIAQDSDEASEEISTVEALLLLVKEGKTVEQAANTDRENEFLANKNKQASILAAEKRELARQEKIDEVIFDKLKDRADEISDVYRELKRDVEMSEKRLLIEIKSLKNDIGARVGVLERYKWLILGGAIVIGWIMSKNLMPLIHMMNGA